ncbi:3-phosphoshikimate 1-carboxyvinyltransferase [Dokdonia pacifica]|uniref:3-phosphoshikimate 1-carboxyvinyltransferase n=1 Tax=Dokdonia pacifica TaxID=1627892 RepID=A0A239C322_9FLAO|nr:3-phosphoshikimate 1-carboxyvinyltransferase [Dokdonia pacifica]GGG26812.1 3-phosphoshikimate 1-carboxyvinyltransferase [Dokdonia pacifica]SNS14520.1 3-phosphoshikimate 1-carboxyvinyltransferase [Dokdonia pacifica]
MLLNIQNTHTHLTGAIKITGSKSETNRLLLLQALFKGIAIENLSNSDDGMLMQKALLSDAETIDIHHAGTAMRFLTAYFAIQKGRKTILTGSKRMQERPIGILVDALRSLGAQIEYQKEEGYPPLCIQGTSLTKNEVTLKANVSSQYISALMLIGATLPEGLIITLEGKITSVPYINMTLQLLHQLDIIASFEGQSIKIQPAALGELSKTITVESDWSSASYYYSLVALMHKHKDSHPTEITISSYKKDSLQGDAVLAKIYTELGVTSHFENHALTLRLDAHKELPETLTLDLSNSPDIAQTIAVSCFGLGIACDLSGLHTLKIKETDRLEALKAEITKLGGDIEVTDKTLHLKTRITPIKENCTIATYHDHRMAMAFAPLGLFVPICIEDAGVVSKSYPDFWEDLKTLGFKQEIIH